MRNSIILVGLGVTLAAVSAARAQTVEAIVMPAAKPAVVAQAPVAVPPSGVVLPPEPIVAATAPVETFETVPRRAVSIAASSVRGRSIA